MLVRRCRFELHRKFQSISTSKRSMASAKVQLDIQQGKIVGVENKLPNGKPFYAFKGIPYAEPPIGNLRFIAPKPLERFIEPTLDCSKERGVCYQKDFVTSKTIGSEDCLFLNVFTPNVNGGANLPVMVWIHGGAFVSGSGDTEYYSPEYLVEQNVVIVTLNYRLSMLGFLCLPEAGVYGNAGLKDQRLALQWIQQNIAKFNGNPDNVTLFGESVGAACVHLHTLSPSSQKYFHKAICQSGNGVMEWGFSSAMEERSIRLARSLGCTETNQEKILQFLRNVDDLPTLFQHYSKSLSPDERRRGLPIAFKPTIERESEEAVLTRTPIEIMRDANNSANIPIMMGYNSLEGLFMFIDSFKKIEQIDNDLARLIPRSVNLAPEDPRCQIAAQKVRDFYLDGKTICEENYEVFTDLLTDYHFTILSALAVELHAKYQKSPMYFYRFDVDMELNLYKNFALSAIGMKGTNKFRGTCHADEIYYLFKFNKFPIDPVDFPGAELVLRRTCALWTNFAKYGNPTPGESSQIENWPTWHPIDKSAYVNDARRWDYMAMENDKIEMRTNPDHDRLEFWRKIYDEYNDGLLKAKL